LNDAVVEEAFEEAVAADEAPLLSLAFRFRVFFFSSFFSSFLSSFFSSVATPLLLLVIVTGVSGLSVGVDVEVVLTTGGELLLGLLFGLLLGIKSGLTNSDATASNVALLTTDDTSRIGAVAAAALDYRRYVQNRSSSRGSTGSALV